MNKTAKLFASASGIILVSLVIALVAALGPTLYSRAVHNWGTACHAFDIQDLPSPGETWIARTQHVGCGGEMDGSRYVEVVLVHNGWFSFLMKEHQVFARELTHRQDTPIDIQWDDENNISLAAEACLPACHAGDGNPADAKTPGACEDWCKSRESVKGVNVAFIPKDYSAKPTGN